MSWGRGVLRGEWKLKVVVKEGAGRKISEADEIMEKEGKKRWGKEVHNKKQQ